MSTPPEQPPRTGSTYGYQPGTTLDIARLPNPGHAELFISVVVLHIYALVAISTVLAALILKTTAAAAQNATEPQPGVATTSANKRVGAAAGAARRNQKASDREDGHCRSSDHKSASTAAVGATAARGDTDDSAE